jgi:lactoylglutathione lyase
LDAQRRDGQVVDPPAVVQELENIGAITLFVSDVERAKEWYRRVFDRPIVHEDDQSAVLRFGPTLINLLAIGEAPGLISPAVVGAGDAGTRFQFTIWVDDIDATLAELRGRGVELTNGPLDRPWGQRTACFADPDGHLWEVAQTIG